MNKVLKELRTWFRKQYADIVSGFDSKRIKEDDLRLYLDNAPNYFAVIDLAQKNAQEKARVEHYKEVVDNDKLLPEKLRGIVEEERQLLIEEYNMTESGHAFEKEKGIRKYNKLQKLSKRIEQSEVTLNALGQLQEAFEPPKRKPGRPKKGKNKQSKEEESPEKDDK